MPTRQPMNSVKKQKETAEKKVSYEQVRDRKLFLFLSSLSSF